MVDRITPQTTDADRAWLRDEVGVEDGWPVVAEPFRQWVLEDRFAAGRPRWEDVGALFTDRVHDWELYKLRMLNATHSCMAYLMAIEGVVYVDEAIAIPVVRRYLATVPAAERAHDPQGDRAASFAVRSLADPPAFLDFDAVFTPRLRESDRFGEAFAAASRELAVRGPVGALDVLLSS